MNVLRLFVSDQIPSRKTVLIAVGVLGWFGVSTNALYDFWKLLPTVFVGDATVDLWNIFLSLSPPLSFVLFITFWVYPQYVKLMKKPAPGNTSRRRVTLHKGIIFAVSAPQGERKSTEEQIIEKIVQAKKPEDLYAIQSIGQSFKGMYQHKSMLRFVWPITTDKSKGYRICIEEFLKRFMPDAVCAGAEACQLKSNNNALDEIEAIKELLSKIYAQESLNTYSLDSSEIIVDVTGGNKLMSIGMTLGALDAAIDIQYVEQQNYDVIPITITPEIILDKVGHYLLDLYAKTQAAKAVSA